MPPINTPCACCNRSFESLLMVKCCICKKSFKNSCVDISANEVRVLNGNKGYDWSCKNCREFGSDIKDLKALILKLQDDIQALKSENSEMRSSVKGIDFEEIVEEINERNKRKRNLVIFRLPEQDQEQPVAARMDEDKAKVIEVLQQITPNFNGENIKPIRLGHFTAGKNRAIKITLDDEEQVNKITRKAYLLKNSNQYRNISVSLDRTPRQIAYYKMIKNQLSEREIAGERNLKIKYNNGIPKIVNLN